MSAGGPIERSPDAQVRVGMKRTWSAGTSAIDLSPLELSEPLAVGVPRFHPKPPLCARVLAGNAAWREELVPKAPSSTGAEREARASLRPVKRDGTRWRGELPDGAALGWAGLLERDRTRARLAPIAPCLRGPPGRVVVPPAGTTPV